MTQKLILTLYCGHSYDLEISKDICVRQQQKREYWNECGKGRGQNGDVERWETGEEETNSAKTFHRELTS